MEKKKEFQAPSDTYESSDPESLRSNVSYTRDNNSEEDALRLLRIHEQNLRMLLEIPAYYTYSLRHSNPSIPKANAAQRQPSFLPILSRIGSLPPPSPGMEFVPTFSSYLSPSMFCLSPIGTIAVNLANILCATGRYELCQSACLVISPIFQTFFLIL